MCLSGLVYILYSNLEYCTVYTIQESSCKHSLMEKVTYEPMGTHNFLAAIHTSTFWFFKSLVLVWILARKLHGPIGSYIIFSTHWTAQFLWFNKYELGFVSGMGQASRSYATCILQRGISGGYPSIHKTLSAFLGGGISLTTEFDWKNLNAGRRFYSEMPWKIYLILMWFLLVTEKEDFLPYIRVASV